MIAGTDEAVNTAWHGWMKKTIRPVPIRADGLQHGFCAASSVQE